MLPKHPKIVAVYWEDAAFVQGNNMSRREVHELEPTFQTSVGFLMERSKERIILAGSIVESGEETGYNDILTIPSAMVRSVKFLR